MSLAWGNYANGNIPTSALTAVPNFRSLGGFDATVAAGSNRLKTEAAIQLSGLMQAFYRRFGRKLQLSEGYRPIATQNTYWSRYVNHVPGANLAALPGTSLHGWALSADLASGDRPFNAVEVSWMHATAPKHGFTPDVPTEPWHYTYKLTPTIRTKALIADPNTTAAKPAATPIPDEGQDSMLAITNTTNKARFALGVGRVKHHTNSTVADLVRNVSSATDEEHTLTDAQVKDLFEAYGVPREASDPNWLAKNENDGNHIWSRSAELKALLLAKK